MFHSVLPLTLHCDCKRCPQQAAIWAAELDFEARQVERLQLALRER